jgi:MFS family permease
MAGEPASGRGADVYEDASKTLRIRVGLFVLLTAGGLASLIGTALTPVLSTVAEHFGGGTAGALVAQNIVTIASIGVIIGGPLAGLSTRFFSIRTTLIVSLLIYAIFGSAGMYLDSAPALLTARMLQGIGKAGVMITTAALVADCFEGPARAKFLGYRDAFLAAFGFFALNGSGMLADAAGWRANFGLYLIALPLVAMVMWGRFPISEKAKAEAANPTPVKDKRGAWALWPIYLAAVALYLLAYTLYLNLSFLLAEEGLKSSTLQGRILATSTVLHFIGSMFYGRVVGKIGADRVIIVTLLTMALSDFTIGFAPNTLWIVVGTGLAGLAGGYLQIYLTNLVLTKAPAHLRSECVGYLYSAMFIGMFIDPYLVTPLREAVGNHEAFLVVGSVLLTSAIVLMIRRRLKPEAAE